MQISQFLNLAARATLVRENLRPFGPGNGFGKPGAEKFSKIFQAPGPERKNKISRVRAVARRVCKINFIL